LVDLGLAEAVAEPLVQREAAGEVAKRLIMVAELGTGEGKEPAG
jgi:hypothetical protein